MSTWPRFLCLYSHIESKAELTTFLFVRRKERRGSEGFIYSPSLFSLEEERLCSVSLLTLFSRDHQQTLFLFVTSRPLHMQYPTKAWSPTSATSTSRFNLCMNWISLSLAFAFKAYKTFSSNLKTIGGYILSRSFKTLNYVGL